MPDPRIVPTQTGSVVDLYSCGHCGFIEGEKPQAGCCRQCGQSSESRIGEYVTPAGYIAVVTALREIAQHDNLQGVVAANALADLGANDPLLERVFGRDA